MSILSLYSTCLIFSINAYSQNQPHLEKKYKLALKQNAKHGLIDFVVTPDNKKIYAIDALQQKLIIKNLNNNQLSKEIIIHTDYDHTMGRIKLSSSGNHAYFSAMGALYRIDTQSDAITAAIQQSGTALNGVALAISADEKHLYSADGWYNEQGDVGIYDFNFSNIQTNRISKLQQDMGFVDMLLADNDNALILRSNVDPYFTIMDLKNKTMQTVESPHGDGCFIIENPITKLIYLSTYSSVDVYDRNKHQFVASIPVARDAMGMAITPDGKKLYVASRAAGTVSVIDLTTNQLIKSILVGNKPLVIHVSADGKLVYVSVDPFGISVIDSKTDVILKTIKLSND